MADDKKEKKDKRVVDLDSVNFRNKDVMKWTKTPRRQQIPYSKKKTYGLKQLGSGTKAPRL